MELRPHQAYVLQYGITLVVFHKHIMEFTKKPPRTVKKSQMATTGQQQVKDETRQSRRRSLVLLSQP